MKSLTLGRKALLICLVLGLLDVLQGTYSLVNLYRSRSTVNALNSDTYATLYWAGKLKGVAKDQRMAVVFYLYSSSKEEMDKYSALVESNEQELRAIRDKYPKFDARERDAIAVSAREQAKFYQAWKEISELVLAGKKKEGWEVYNTKLMAATLSRRKMEDELANIGNERGQLLSKNAIHAVSVGIPVVWVILFLTIVLGTSSFLLFVSSVRRSSCELKESDDRLTIAILATRTAGLGVWVHEVGQGRMIWDDQMFSIYGIAIDLFAGTFQGWLSMVHPEDRQRLGMNAADFNQRETISELEYRIIWPDGSVHYIRSFALGQRNASGQLTHVIGTNWDTTAQKQAEMKLRESEERYRELFENASDLVYTFDLEMGITSLNRLAEQTIGYTREEVMHMNVRKFVNAEYWERIERVLGQLVAGFPVAKFEVEIKAKDGRRVMLEINPRVILKDGKATEIQGIARDITGRDAAEIELRQAQKLESVGRLAAGIAHEINTPMQFVGDNVRFLQDSFTQLQVLLCKLRGLCDPSAGIVLPPTFSAEFQRLETEMNSAFILKEIPEAIVQTLDGIDRVVTIVRAMKEFAHPEGKGMAHADINRALLNTLGVARNELKYVAEVVTDFGDVPLVVCSLSDINQVFLNLLVNAAHAIGDVVQETGQKGTIRIETRVEGSMVLIAVADTGAGIPENIRDQIFDPFFTTKEVGRGTGQGLAIARSVVDRHKGSLTFESEVGKGTTFRICLPIDGIEPMGAVIALDSNCHYADSVA
jgi:PAS domain S-box-containing protein